MLGSKLPLIASLEISDDNYLPKIDVDYLDNLPRNDYIIGPGDELRISISREYPELKSNVLIDGEGTIYLPRLLRIYVSGLSINELNSLLNKAYEKFVKFPNVEVQITKYRPISVFVQGEVESPGLKVLKGSLSLPETKVSSMDDVDGFFPNQLERTNNVSGNFIQYFPTVFDAVQKSGGITTFSDLKNIQVIRKNNISEGGGEISTILNLEDLLLYGDNKQNIRIYDSDVIKIPSLKNANPLNLNKAILSNLNPKYINVLISGRVNNPGIITVSKSSVLTDAVGMAGGTKILKGPVTFLRFERDGKIDKRKFKFNKKAKRGSYSNPFLKQSDVIMIGKGVLASSNEVISEVTQPLTGVFSAYGLIKAISD